MADIAFESRLNDVRAESMTNTASPTIGSIIPQGIPYPLHASCCPHCESSLALMAETVKLVQQMRDTMHEGFIDLRAALESEGRETRKAIRGERWSVGKR
jgi:hypothetical protein